MQELLTNKTLEKLKHDLVREGLVSYEDLTDAEEASKATGRNLAQILIKHQLISEDALLSFIENKLHIPYVNLDDYTLDTNCLDYIPYEEAIKYRVIPLFKIEDVLTIAMADPMDLFLLRNLINSISCKIEPIICSERSILQTIQMNYKCVQTNKEVVDDIRFDWQDELNLEVPDELHVQKILEAIICQGVFEKSQEIFLEPTFNGLAVKFKTDGEIFDRGYIPILLVPSSIVKLKNMSGLDPAISEMPQLGKLKFSFDEFKLNNNRISTIIDKVNLPNSKFSASVSTFPTLKGERVSLKMYKPPIELEELDISADKINALKSALEKPGIIIVAGKNQSEQISFIYSLLSYLNRSKKDIITVESIVKHDIPGIHQCEINEQVGFSIEKVLKHINFQSPDVVYFESLFSGESLEFAASLTLTGKLVIVGVSTNSLFDAVEKYVNCTISLDNKRIEIV